MVNNDNHVADDHGRSRSVIYEIKEELQSAVFTGHT